MSALKNKKGGVSGLFCLIWSSPMVVFGAIGVLLGYVTYYATNVLGLPIGLVGTLMLISKLIEGVASLVGGYIVDRTETKIGKGRPYDITYVLFSVFTIFLFSIPAMSMTATAAAVFILYTLIFSVFQTLSSCAGIVYMGRAIEDNEDRVKVVTIQGLLIMVVATVVGVIVPQMIEAAGTSRAEWSKMALIICIPCAIISMFRIFIIKENRKIAVSAATRINLKESLYVLMHNKPLIIYSLALLMVNIAAGLSPVGMYYFQFVVKDIGSQSFMSLATLGSVFFIPFFPMLVKKFGTGRFMTFSLIVGIIGKLLPAINNTNLIILFISGLAFTLSYMPLYQLSPNALLDCIDYGEWKLGVRVEGLSSCIGGICSKIGTGIGGWLVGFLMAFGGYDETMTIQSQSAITSMKLLFIYIPAVLVVIAVIFMNQYKLDKEMPRIRKELEEKRSSVIYNI